MIKKKVVLSQENNLYIGQLEVDDKLIRLNSSLGSITKQGNFYFYVLQDLRLELQKDNVFILVNGSRKEVYPSGMSLPSYKAYFHTLGKPTTIADLIDIFDDFTDLNLISTVEEQIVYHDIWIQSISSL